MAIEIRVDVSGLDRLIAKVGDNPKMNAEIADAWSILYRSFARLRFAKQAKGAGEWPGLKPATIKRRRKGRASRNKSGRSSAGVSLEILRDTGALFGAMVPGVQGGILQSRLLPPIGVTIFLGGGKTYKNGPTLTEVAEFHHEGKGRLPKRTILVQPDAATLGKMRAVAKKIVTRHLNE